MGDPHAVVFHLPEGAREDPFLFSGITEVTTNTGLGASDNLVKQIMLQMRGYLIDNDVQIIELTSKTLKVFISLVFAGSDFILQNRFIFVTDLRKQDLILFY